MPRDLRDHPDRSAVRAREAAFHDGLVESRDPTAAAPEAPDPWERALLEAVGSLNGSAVLDYGCGTGSLSIHAADCGADRVTGIDVSSASISLAQRRAALFRPRAPIEYMATSAESTGLPDESFDVVLGKFVLHHLDVAAAATELHRLLRPGGRGAFMETSGLNPVSLAVRTQIFHRGRFGAEQVGTDDERPLTRDDLRILRRRFPQAIVDYPIFWLARPFARQLLAARYPELGHRVAALDERVERRLNVLRPLSYHMRITLRKPTD